MTTSATTTSSSTTCTTIQATGLQEDPNRCILVISPRIHSIGCEVFQVICTFAEFQAQITSGQTYEKVAPGCWTRVDEYRIHELVIQNILNAHRARGLANRLQ